MNRIQGVIPILAAPFTSDGAEIDYDDLRALIDFVIAEGAHGVALLGVASEFYKISDEERARMIETTIAHTAGRVPVIVNITRHASELAVKDAKHAEAAGADAIMVIPPYFMSPSGAAVARHIQAVAAQTELPVMIQYAPDVTGAGIPTETFLEFADSRKGDVYIKAESIPPGALISAIVERTNGRMGVFIGNSARQMIDALRRGAVGLMPGCSMVRVYVEIYNEYVHGSRERATEMFDRLLPVINMFSQTAETLIRYEKIILRRRGILKSDYCRTPAYEPDAAYVEWLDEYSAYMVKHFNYSI
ncbi:dihydrodipicolinate synthase family protein [Paenibacillaceae bacterium WGS1546]|uniref:dihydrodipicolinate synthase family protein n=1 Tax=Cohnella sp. WGS1546 TaxID=3366810 RepID=UPI00372D5303